MQPLDENFFKNHVTFSSVPDMVKLTEPLTSIGLSYFTFDRTYEDGTHCRLTNAGKWIESYYRTELYKQAIFEKDPRLFCNGFVFWSWLNREPIYSAASEHNIDHGLTIIERHGQYSDFYHFGTTLDNYISQEKLINQIHFLYRFIAYFKQEAHKLLMESERTRFALEVPAHQEIHLQEIKHHTPQALEELLKKTQVSRLYLGDEFDNAYLTRRELDILTYLKDGSKPVQIANALSVSNRTLETHIKNIKEKFKCSTLFDLGFKLGAIGARNLYPFQIRSENAEIKEK